MKVYSLLTHPNIQSLNGALFSTTNEFFKQQGWAVETQNVYTVSDEIYNATKEFRLTEISAKQRNYQSSFHYSYQHSACENLTEFSQREIEQLKQADILYVQTPIMLWTMPAVLKSYMEWVFLPFVVFETYEPWSSDFKHKNLLRDKKVFVSITTGASKEYCTYGIGGVDQMIHPIKSLFEFVGFQWLEPHVTWRTSGDNTQQHPEYLIAQEQHLRELFSND